MLAVSRWHNWGERIYVWVLLVLVGGALAACSMPIFSNRASLPSQISATSSSQQTVTLQPASGYGGLYIEVTGVHWPQNMMVIVRLEDAKGRSETLAAVDTDQSGNLSTGFLYPIDQRWLSSSSPWVVVTTADGRVEAKSRFTVVPPGEQIAGNSPEQTGAANPFTHTLGLPLVVVAGAESAAPDKRASNRNAAIVDVPVVIDSSKPINCRCGDSWITLAILSTDGFDAGSIDPGSVVVGDGPLAWHREERASNISIALQSPEVQRGLSAYQWRWHSEDVNQDGRVDLVMEFQIRYTELTCDSTTIEITGRTKDGRSFVGSQQVDMIAMDQG